MTRAAVLSWLDTRRPVPPEALQRHLAAAVGDADLPLPDHLAAIGGALLQRVTRAAGGAADRIHALDLLAADAFVTYAFEAQAEDDVGGLPALAERLGRLVEGT